MLCALGHRLFPFELRLGQIGRAEHAADLLGHRAHRLGKISGRLGLPLDDQRILHREQLSLEHLS